VGRGAGKGVSEGGGADHEHMCCGKCVPCGDPHLQLCVPAVSTWAALCNTMLALADLQQVGPCLPYTSTCRQTKQVVGVTPLTSLSGHWYSQLPLVGQLRSTAFQKEQSKWVVALVWQVLLCC
jgi:hypothetical protein